MENQGYKVEKKINKRQLMAVASREFVHPQGLVDSHTHLWIDDGNINNNSISKQNDFQLVKKLLSDFKKVGGSLIGDCTPYGCGRDANILYKLSKISGVKIISVTGFHKKQYYINDFKIWDMDKKQACKFFLSEINKLKESRDIILKPGAIKFAYIGTLKDQYLTLSLAAIEASKETGLPLVVHTEKGKNIRKLVDFFKKEKMDMSRILLCHMDKNNNKDLHEELIEYGFFLEYDTFLRPKYDPEKNVSSLLTVMIQEGNGSNILLGSDIDSITMWKDLEESGGYKGFFNSIKKVLSSHQIKFTHMLPIMSLNAFNFFNLKETN